MEYKGFEQGKDVPRPALELVSIDATEFRPLDEDLTTDLVGSHGYSKEMQILFPAPETVLAPALLNLLQKPV